MLLLLLSLSVLRWSLLSRRCETSRRGRERGRDDARLLNDGIVGVGSDVQSSVDRGGDGLDLGTEFLFNTVEVESIFVRYQVDGESEVTVSSGTTDPVEVRLGVLGEVEIDDDVDCLDIDTSSEEIGTDEVTAQSTAEVVEDSVTVVLKHLGVRVEARVAQLCDLLGEEFDSVRGVAEDDRLVDLELGE